MDRNIPQYDVIGIGASTIDILTVVDHYPDREGVQEAITTTLQGGGPIATALVTLAKLGAKTAMMDVLGNDWRGTRIKEEFQEYGVSTEWLQVQSGCTSPISNILVNQHEKSRHIIFSPGNTPELSPSHVHPELISSARFIHINGRHRDACLAACKIAKKCGTQVSFDGGANRYRPELDELLRLTDICIVAKNFAEAYTQENDLEKAAQKILLDGSKPTVITDGTNGSWIFTREGDSFHQPAYRLSDSVDTTGCGDSYHGAFLYGLCRDMTLRETSAFASAVAALNTRQLGGRAALPTLSEVEMFLGQHETL